MKDPRPKKTRDYPDAEMQPKPLNVCDSAAEQMTFWDLPETRFDFVPVPGTVAKKSQGQAKPFVKWAGGKGQLLELLDGMLPSDFSTRKDLVYVEPFVGGGAMLFHILSKYPNVRKAVINDLNTDLITCYRVIKERPEELISALKDFHAQYRALKSEEKRRRLFLDKRDRYNSHPADKVETAAIFIFLNRTCFNGLYRVNSKGQYNVPFGKAVNPLICDEATIRADSEALKKVEVLCGDFERVANFISPAAFFYFDPPYRPLTQTSAFTAYSKHGFGDEQQIRLANFTKRLAKAGNQWLLSNSDPHNTNECDNFFDDLFSGFNIQRVDAMRIINSKADKRGKITELLIRNY
ncbi:MAG: DNA adenine methylase [Victivallales bacterium]|nr:DNA adenine methylase [Victivallales bacterium]